MGNIISLFEVSLFFDNPFIKDGVTSFSCKRCFGLLCF